MNIFEDLIEELKEENLLEATPVKAAAKSNPITETADKRKKRLMETVDAASMSELETDEALEEIKNKTDETEFHRRRAMNEVSFLQMVEYVFAGVEREHLKIVPKPYDALEVKKILHSFLQISHESQNAEHVRVQFQLLQETESWHSSLALRDRQIMTAHLRRYCEVSRPPLSSPALVALASFYRNSPYSELIRSKFDLIITRLFSKETGKSRRELLFERGELVVHLTDLYADWSSASLYSTETNNTKLQQIVGNFDAFMTEAENAVDFDELIKNNFFNRLHKFKESTNENFFAPLVAAIAVESNIRVGNLYVKLLENEKSNGKVADLENKYGSAHDQSISEATGKTFALTEVLNQKAGAPPPKVNHVIAQEKNVANENIVTKIKVQPAEKATFDDSDQPTGFDKRLILLAAGVVLIMLIFYFNM